MPEHYSYSWVAINEAQEWATGKRSHLSEMIAIETSPEQRQQTHVAAAQMNAAEVVKLSALAVALVVAERVGRNA